MPEIETSSNPEQEDQGQPIEPGELLDKVKVTTKQESLNVLVQFLNIGQKRGAYSLEEAALIWKCIKFFEEK